MTMKARPSNGTLNPLSPVVLFGLDQHGSPKAARFPEEQASLAIKAAEQLQLRILKVTDPAVAELAAQLPTGRIHANGKGAVPNVRGELYSKLLAAAETGEAANHPSPKRPAEGQSNGKPPNGTKALDDQLLNPWDTIASAQMALARDEGDNDWHDVVVVERTGDICTLRWRDYPRARKFSRHCRAVALLCPNTDA